MRIHQFLFSAALLFVFSCNQNNKPSDSADNKETSEQADAAGNNTTSGEFDIENIPLSTKETGNFPYVVVPEGYKYGSGKEKRLEEKYFFYNNSFIKKVSGQYFHTAVYQDGEVFEDTFLVTAFRKQIEALGGIEIYSGGLPNAAGDLIGKEKPNYVADMYDPIPYQYKQFLIRTPTDNIWIELCHGLNANQIDLTVVREENKK